MQMNQFTKDEMPAIESGDTVTLTTEDADYTAAVTDVQNNGASVAYSLQIDGTDCMMYADVRCVELIYENQSHFISDITVE